MVFRVVCFQRSRELKIQNFPQIHYIIFFRVFYETFCHAWPIHLTVSKVGLWWGSFIQSRKCMSLKFTEVLFFITKKNDAKFERIWLVVLKQTWGIWWVLTQTLQSLKSCTLVGSFSPKYTMFQLKKYRGVKEKLTCGLENDVRNSPNF